jgi:hypothetical protein
MPFPQVHMQEGLIDRYCSPTLIHYRFQEVSMQAILDQIADWL